MKVFPLSVPKRSKQMTEEKTGQTESPSSPNQIPVLTFENLYFDKWLPAEKRLIVAIEYPKLII